MPKHRWRCGARLALALATSAAPSFALAAPKQPVGGRHVVQYYASWSGTSQISSIPWSKLTQVVVSFAGIDAGGHCAWVNDTNSGSVGSTISNSSVPALITALKAARDANNPNVMITLSVGGQALSYRFSDAVANNPSGLATSCVSFINTLGLDGLDYDWEYPTKYNDGSCPSGIGISACSRSSDGSNFASLLRYTRSALDSSASLGTSAHLSVATNSVPSGFYSVAAMDPYLTTWNVMTYEYGGCWSGTTAYNAPVSWAKSSLATWQTNGATKAKLVLGTPYYSNVYTGVSGHTTGMSFSGCSSDYTFGSVYQTCRSSACQIYSNYDSSGNLDAKVCYCSGARTWYQYDDADTTAAKASYVSANGYGGMLGWALPGDSGTILSDAIVSHIPPTWSGGASTPTKPDAEPSTPTVPSTPASGMSMSLAEFVSIIP